MRTTDENAPTVLVVEDDPDQGFIYEQFLGREGFNVATATSAKEARTFLAGEAPAAVILDLSIDGFSLLTHIREHDTTKDLPVVVVSGRRLAEDEHPPETRWDYYVEKPPNLAELAGLLKKHTRS